MEDSVVILGLMSGTSLDGTDLALCRFNKSNPSEYEILKGVTCPYPEEIIHNLKKAETSAGAELIFLHRKYGRYLGNIVREFLQEHNTLPLPQYVSSHGHTIFHEPSKGLTFQLGCGAELAIHSGLDAVCDFRTTDVALGGQGAPLVPVGDQLLFPQYPACLNLGGFANISFRRDQKVIAGDICPVNYVMNDLSKRIGLTYDAEGSIARSGQLIPDLKAKLDQLDYYQYPFPKSLAREWTEKNVFPLLSNKFNAADLLRTFSEHAAEQIAHHCKEHTRVLVTGGGAYNSFLIERIREQSNSEICVPDNGTIEYKEALIFALLGLLRVENKVNSLASVTGAARDSIGGCIYKA